MSTIATQDVTGNWTEYRRLVLSELQRLARLVDEGALGDNDIRARLSSIESKLLRLDELDRLAKEVTEIKTRTASIATAISTVIGAIVSALANLAN